MPARRKDPNTGEEILTTKEYLFVEAYLGAAQGNATQAALMAGYAPKNAKVIGAQNLSKLNIQKRIEQRKLEAKISTDEVLRGIADTMRLNFEDFFDIVGGKPVMNLDKAKERGKLHLIKGLSYDKSGNMVLQFYSSFEAKKLLVDVLGLKTLPRVNEADAEQWRKIAKELSETFNKPIEEVARDLISRKPELASVLIH